MTWRSVMVIALGIALAGPAARGEQPIDVQVWPDDVPCGILQKNPDGSIETTAPIRRFFAVHAHMKFHNTRETSYWDRKCGFAMQGTSVGAGKPGASGLLPGWVIYGAAGWAGCAAILMVWLLRRRKGG